MSKVHKDINDNEIRVISPTQPAEPQAPVQARPRKPWPWIVLALIIVAAVVALVWALLPARDEQPLKPAPAKDIEAGVPQEGNGAMPTVLISDTTVNGTALTLLRPLNLTPSLHLGTDVLSDSTVKMAFQAADIRADNGGIVGAFVLKGDLLSKGQSKAGFCAILGGAMTIGVADSTPLLEQAIETDGYFFRQFPLVVGGQIVENKQTSSALRKALAEIGGQHIVVLSKDRLTMHDFSQALTDLGVSNAIYLVGSTSYGFATDPRGRKAEFGQRVDAPAPNTTYILWR